MNDQNEDYRDDVGEKVGQEIDRQYMRFAELLLGLAGGTIGIVVGFLVGSKPILFGHKLIALMIGLIVLGVSALISFWAMLTYIEALRNNWHFQWTQDKKPTAERIIELVKKQKDLVKRLRCLLSTQFILFAVGEASIIVYLFIARIQWTH